MKQSILVVDDKKNLCMSLVMNFEQFGYVARYALNSSDALSQLNREIFNAVVLDLRLGEENGLSLLKTLMKSDPLLPVVILTGHGTIETAVEAIKLGAYDYIQKPANIYKLRKVVENAIEMASLKRENMDIKSRFSDSCAKIITQNAIMCEIIERTKQLADSELPILIYGESGTGKELFADLIHLSSKRVAQEIIKINCASFSDTLVDSELFGHEKGAFTGAQSTHPGLFEQANKGTLFLDEIGDMPLPTQAKILRAIQNQEIRRLGAKKNLAVDVRLIGATNKNLEKLVEQNLFRSDLFFRLNTASIRIPPLRERKDDIGILCHHFIVTNIGNPINKDLDDLIDPAVLLLFNEYDWPGNIRELKNAISYALTVSKGDKIEIKHLPHGFSEKNTDSMYQAKDIIHSIEREKILQVLHQTENNKKRAAELLHISRRTLYNKLEKYGIQ